MGRQQLLGQVGLLSPRARFFEAGSSPSYTGDSPASAADRAQDHRPSHDRRYYDAEETEA